jgi:acyl-CoA synthetase (AMP-forming)/AMP-acid ligase II
MLASGSFIFVEAFFGGHFAGVIPVPAYPPRRNRNMDRINAISENCQAVVALSVRKVIDRNEGMLDDAPSLDHIPWIAIEEIPEEKAGDWIMPKISGSDVGLIQCTSGSTGRPKGMLLSQENLMANCRMITILFGQKTLDSSAIS